MGRDLNKASLREIMDHISTKYHTQLEEELPKLSQLTKKIHRVHREDHGEVLGAVEKLFNDLKLELENHIKVENDTIFPLIKEYESNPSGEVLQGIAKASKELENNHIKIEDILRELKRITADYMDPREACHSCNITLGGLMGLHSLVLEYINSEKNISNLNL